MRKKIKPKQVIKRGDSYYLPFDVRLNGKPLNPEKVDKIEFFFGDFCKVWKSGVDLYALNRYLLGLDQQDTFSMSPGLVYVDTRVKFKTGEVKGDKRPFPVLIVDSNSEEIL